MAQKKIAKEFFEEHRDELWKFGANFAKRSVDENATDLAAADNFAQRLRSLKYRERAIGGHGSKQVSACFPKVIPEQANDGIGGVFGDRRSHKPYSVDEQQRSGIATYSELRRSPATREPSAGGRRATLG